MSDEERDEHLAALEALTGRPVGCISSVSGVGLKELRWGLWNTLQALDPIELADEAKKLRVRERGSVPDFQEE